MIKGKILLLGPILFLPGCSKGPQLSIDADAGYPCRFVTIKRFTDWEWPRNVPEQDRRTFHLLGALLVFRQDNLPGFLIGVQSSGMSSPVNFAKYESLDHYRFNPSPPGEVNRVTIAEWNSAHAASFKWSNYNRDEDKSGFQVIQDCPVNSALGTTTCGTVTWTYQGKKYRQTAPYVIGPSPALTSPSQRFVAFQSWLGYYGAFGYTPEPNRIAVDFYDVASATKLFTLKGPVEGGQPTSILKSATWLTDRYYIMSANRNMTRLLVCDLENVGR